MAHFAVPPVALDTDADANGDDGAPLGAVPPTPRTLASRMGEMKPIHYAAQLGSDECVGLLLSAGADVNERTAGGVSPSPLHLAAGADSPSCINLLASAGADVDALDNVGRGAAHYAAECGSARALRALHAAGASMVVEDARGTTPLHLAERFQHTAASSFLEAGPPPPQPEFEAAAPAPAPAAAPAPGAAPTGALAGLSVTLPDEADAPAAAQALPPRTPLPLPKKSSTVDRDVLACLCKALQDAHERIADLETANSSMSRRCELLERMIGGGVRSVGGGPGSASMLAVDVEAAPRTVSFRDWKLRVTPRAAVASSAPSTGGSSREGRFDFADEDISPRGLASPGVGGEE